MRNNQKYAKALFDLSYKSNSIESINNQLKSINYLFNKVPAFRLVLITKRLNAKNKKDIISKTLKMFDALVLDFLIVVIENQQANNLSEIISQFNLLANNHLTVKQNDNPIIV